MTTWESEDVFIRIIHKFCLEINFVLELELTDAALDVWGVFSL